MNVLLTSQSTNVTDENCTDELLIKSFGAFDFEDSHYGYFVFELTVAVAYVIAKAAREGHQDPWRFGGHFVRGYVAKRQLSQVEYDVIVTSVATRFAVSYVMSKDCDEQMAEDNDILEFHSGMMGTLLRKYHEAGKEKISDMILGVLK